MVGKILLSILACLPTAVFAQQTAESPVPRSSARAGIGRLAPEVSVRDIDGARVELVPVGAERATVIAVTSTTCPLSLRFAPLLGRLSRDDVDRNVRWIFIDATGSGDADDFREFAGEHGFSGALLHDRDHELTRSLGCSSTTEAIVIDRRGTVRYRGCVDDRYGIGYVRDEPRITPLSDALFAVLEDRAVAVPATTAPGCELAPSPGRPGEDTPTYHGTISRIVQANCVQCHRTGGAGPFDLSTPDAVLANAAMIKRVVQRGTMPPWFAESPPQHGHGGWVNDARLLAGDVEAITRWVDEGRPIGDPASAPLPRTFATGWSIGAPDRVVRLPEPIAIKAEGEMPYQDIDVALDNDEDLWVTGWEVLPTDRSVVHHVLVFIVGPDGRRRFGPTDGFLAAYVPGNGHTSYAKGAGKRIPAGSTLHFQIHYTPNGRATTDQMAIGLRLAEGPLPTEIRTIGIADTEIRIPPGARDHREGAFLTLPTDVRVLSITPHMHVRGASFKCSSVDPDGLESTLLDVPVYDFNWQLRYQYADPVLISRGTRVRVEATFDNSVDNPANPDPKQRVRWGKQTDDEMLIAYIEYWHPEAVDDPEILDRASDDAIYRGQAERLIARWDRNDDDRLERDEVPESRRMQFDVIDMDDDGLVDADEFVRAMRKLMPR